MTRERDAWPAQAGDPKRLPTEMDPPAELEDRVVDELLRRGAIHRDDGGRHVGWRTMRAALAAAACLALVAIGFGLGRYSRVAATPGSLTNALSGAEVDLYALLLYETPGYDAPSAAEARTRYAEYGQWVAKAAQSGQFVTGEDLDVHRGWLVSPADGEPHVEQVAQAPTAAPLSGIFFIRAADERQALELTRELPHIKHGGKVVVQKTIPTDTPPP